MDLFDLTPVELPNVNLYTTYRDKVSVDPIVGEEAKTIIQVLDEVMDHFEVVDEEKRESVGNLVLRLAHVIYENSEAREQHLAITVENTDPTLHWVLDIYEEYNRRLQAKLEQQKLNLRCYDAVGD